jgi:hypothetical protein
MNRGGLVVPSEPVAEILLFAVRLLKRILVQQPIQLIMETDQRAILEDTMLNYGGRCTIMLLHRPTCPVHCQHLLKNLTLGLKDMTSGWFKTERSRTAKMSGRK